MKLSLKILICALLAVLTAGCKKNEFFLDFSLPEDVSANYRVVYYASSKEGGAVVQATAPVQKGKYTLRGITKEPTVIYISTNFSAHTLVLYAQRGERITIEGKNADPFTWNVGGNEINKTLSQWRQEVADTLETGSEKEINLAIGNFVRSHPDNPASTFLLLTTFARSEDEGLYLSLWNSLKAGSEKSRITALVARADQLSTEAMWPAVIRSVVMRSAQNGTDTLVTSKVDATMLFFWSSGMTDRKALIDSLKKISKEFSDSSRRIIADVSLDADSSVWRSSIRRDSLENVARLWTPAGLADPLLMKMGVGGYPYFIIYNPEGEATYRGGDVNEAFAAFRNLADTVATNQ